MIEAQAERCTMSRYNKESMDNLSVCVGLWQQILTKIVPSLSLPDEKVMGLPPPLCLRTSLSRRHS